MSVSLVELPAPKKEDALLSLSARCRASEKRTASLPRHALYFTKEEVATRSGGSGTRRRAKIYATRVHARALNPYLKTLNPEP